MTGSVSKGSGVGVVYVVALALDKDPRIIDATQESKCCWVTLIAIAVHSSGRVRNMKAALKIVD